jgi:hypothetical protein
VELASDFRGLLSYIEPSATHVAAAKAAHEKVREQLRTDSESKDAHKDTFLSGSYARSTAIRDINDIDVVCLVDIDQTITAPDVVLAWLEAVLARYYSERKRQGRSVGVQAGRGVWLDIVPASPVATDDGPVWIPDREAHTWVKSHPKGQISAGTNKNRATSGYFVQVVKLMKYWRDRLPTESAQPKSYILESLVHQPIGHPSSHAIGVVNVLEGIERMYGAYRGSNTIPFIPDPGFPFVNVAKRWTSSEFDAFMNQVQAARVIARNALDNTEESESRRLWQRLFGAQFGQ